MRVRGLATGSRERGATTAEYATGCVVTAALATTLVQLASNGFIGDLFRRMFDAAFTLPLPHLLGPLL